MVQMTRDPEAIVAFYGVDKLRFVAPVFIGDTIHISQRVLEKTLKNAERGVVASEITVLNQDAKPGGGGLYDAPDGENARMTALDGIKVLDLTRLLPGAVATQWLADFGAEVIKIEQPGVGDYARQGFATAGENPIFALVNRNKKSVEIDLKDAAGKAAFLKLASAADVVIEGFRPDVMDRLGVGYEVLRAANPRLIYAALTGYGAEGEVPLQLAGHDINYLALSGVLDLDGSRERAEPSRAFRSQIW